MRSCGEAPRCARLKAAGSATTRLACPHGPMSRVPFPSASSAKSKHMIDLGSLFDSYNRQARLYPSLIALLPPLITVLAWYPVLLTSNATATAETLVTSCGLLYSFMAFTRSRGRNVERRLLADWGAGRLRSGCVTRTRVSLSRRKLGIMRP